MKLLLLGLVAIVGAEIHFSCVPSISPENCTSLANKASIERRALSCNLLTDVLRILKNLGTPVTAFCSSYLHIPSVTTVPGPTITPGPVTTNVFVTEVATVYVIDFQSSTYTESYFGEYKREYHVPGHDVEARAVPNALEGFAAAEISAACSCLDITPHSTYTGTVTAPATIITQVGMTDLFTTITTTCNPLGGACPKCDPHFCCGGACGCDSYTCIN